MLHQQKDCALALGQTWWGVLRQAFDGAVRMCRELENEDAQRSDGRMHIFPPLIVHQGQTSFQSMCHRSYLAGFFFHIMCDLPRCVLMSGEGGWNCNLTTRLSYSLQALSPLRFRTISTRHLCLPSQMPTMSSLYYNPIHPAQRHLWWMTKEKVASCLLAQVGPSRTRHGLLRKGKNSSQK